VDERMNSAPPTVDVQAVPAERQVSRARPVRLVILIAAVAIVAIGGATTAAWWTSCGWRGCPSADALRAWRPTVGGAVLAADGKSIGTLSTLRRNAVRLKDVSPLTRQAVVAVEDRRFRSHHGVDWRGVVRAMWVNTRALGVREGASTISMQVARLIFLGGGGAEESYSRKLLEARYAYLLESALTKDQILEHYLNTVYLGDGAFGVDAASRSYFGHAAAEATVSEAALLAGLAQAPSLYSPRAHPERARRRRATVLSRLVSQGVITAAVGQAAASAPIEVVDSDARARGALVASSWGAEAARATVDSLRRAGALPAWATDDAITVRTTINARAQRAAERAVARGAAALDARRAPWERDAANTRTQGALVALDPGTGAVRAIVGGRQLERGGFDRARRAARPVGSAFKPFVYATALADTLTVATLVSDTPIELTVGNDVWRPANFDDRYYGPITVRQAVARSANAAAVRVAEQAGIDNIRRVAQRAGITTPLPQVPALALGAAALTPLELTGAYAVFANGGRRVTPHLVLRIDDAFGRVLWRTDAPSARPALDPRDAFLVQSLLRSVVDDGTAQAIRQSGVRGPVGGKTGTTNDATDVWFVGFTPTLVAGVWLGADTPTPLAERASGGRDVAPVWADFVRNGWHSPERDTAWRAPAGLERRRVDALTGLLADEWCGQSRMEWFKVGTAPTRSCREAPASDHDHFFTIDTDEESEVPDVHVDIDWRRVVPDLLEGKRLPSRQEVTRAAEVLRELSARAERELRAAQREAQRAQQEAERAARREMARVRRQE
jgi:1A family penicillin-binding protein